MKLEKTLLHKSLSAYDTVSRGYVYKNTDELKEELKKHSGKYPKKCLDLPDYD